MVRTSFRVLSVKILLIATTYNVIINPGLSLPTSDDQGESATIIIRNKRFFKFSSAPSTTSENLSTTSPIEQQPIFIDHRDCVYNRNNGGCFHTNSGVRTSLQKTLLQAAAAIPKSADFLDEQRKNYSNIDLFRPQQGENVFFNNRRYNDDDVISGGSYYIGGGGDDNNIARYPLPGGGSYEVPDGIRINDVTCTRNNGRSSGRFHMDLSIVPGKSYYYYKPVLESGYIKTTDEPYCAISEIRRDNYQINFQHLKLSPCGVYQCPTQSQPDLMCLALRFPVIRGARTSQDLLVRVRCNPQAEFISHTKHFKLKPLTKDTDGRSLISSAYRDVSVGNSAEPLIGTRMALYKRGESGFTEVINEDHDSVLLGEELQFRCVIINNAAHEDWHYSRLGEVKIQRHLMSTKLTGGYDYGTDDNSESIVVISADGCVNPRMKSICRQGQIIDPNNPLTVSMNMHVFAFDGMKNGDQLFMSVTVYVCTYYDDCYPVEFTVCANHQANNDPYGGRVRRSTTSSSYENKTMDVTSDISFRIRLPDDNGTFSGAKVNKSVSSSDVLIWMCFIAILVVITLSGIAFAILLHSCVKIRDKNFYNNN